jgi:uncharacterized protein involved in exopolysaccharide biosynthesis
MEQPSQYEDVFNLGKYIETLLRQWRLILCLTLIFTLAAYFITLTQSTTYQAQALVATTRSSSDVSFGTNIETISESDINGYRYVDRKARLNTFVELINNPLVAEAVIEDLGDQLNGNQQDPRILMKKVTGSLIPSTDTIAIQVSHNNPILAAAIANAWAQSYVKYINTLYSEVRLDESFQAMQDQVSNAKIAYDVAEEMHVAFKKENRIAELSRQITERQTLIENLSTARIQDLTSQLNESLEEARRVDRLILDAQGMLDQVNSGGSSAVDSNILALMLLKNQAFAANESSTNLTIQTTPGTMTTQSMVKDINGLISALENRRDDLDQNILTLSNQIVIIKSSSEEGVSLSGIEDNQIEQSIIELEEEVRKLEAQLTEQKIQEQELNRAIELTWNTYNNLATKAAELGIAAETTGTELSLAIPASVPLNPNTDGGKRMILISGAAGFIVGILLAFAIEFWWDYKGIKPQPITVKYLLVEAKDILSSKKSN